MIVRGAPAIGVAAAMGIALGIVQSSAKDSPSLRREFDRIAKVMGETRPTAVNLFWAIGRMRARLESIAARPLTDIKAGLVHEAQQMYLEDTAPNQAMDLHGSTLMTTVVDVL